MASAGPLAGRVAFVTGASRGIGAAVAVELGRLGAHVVIAARTEGGLEETDDAIRAGGGAATLLALDLTEGETIDSIGPSLFERFKRLDILVHAAGALGRLTPVGHIQPADWSEVMAVNISSAWRMIRTCGPLLNVAPEGRAVFITDIHAAEPHAYWGAYGATKAAMQHLVLTWAEEVRESRLRVNLFRPGPVATRLRMQAMPGEDASVLPRPADVAPAIAALCLPGEQPHGRIVTP
jgi:NAD(P)-dependent dehydrogenase (short-subunit alcohol dehydrogenase family)